MAPRLGTPGLLYTFTLHCACYPLPGDNTAAGAPASKSTFQQQEEGVRKEKQSVGVSSLKGSEELPQALSVDVALVRTWSAGRAFASRRMENSLHC